MNQTLLLSAQMYFGLLKKACSNIIKNNPSNILMKIPKVVYCIISEVTLIAYL